MSVAKRFSFPGQLPVQTDFAAHLLARSFALLRTSSCQAYKHRSHRELPLEPEPEGNEHKERSFLRQGCASAITAETAALHLLSKSGPGPFLLLRTSMVDVAVISSESGPVMST